MNSRKQTKSIAILATMSFFLLTGAKGGCANNELGDPGIDVAGLWQIDYKDKVTVTVAVQGGAASTYTLSARYGGAFVVEGQTYDLTEFCSRDQVVCPWDVLPEVVTMTQPTQANHLLEVTFNPEGPLAYNSDGTLVGNVDSNDDVLIPLDVNGAAIIAAGSNGAGMCGLVGGSFAQASIKGDGGTPAKGTTMNGELITIYTAGCVAGNSDGAVEASVTVKVSVPFRADAL